MHGTLNVKKAWKAFYSQREIFTESVLKKNHKKLNIYETYKTLN
jgi:hypothetical protein